MNDSLSSRPDARAVLTAIAERRSVAKLVGTVDEADLARMLDAAVAAPNHRTTRPWRFDVLRGAARERLGAVWAPVASAAAGLDGPPGAAYARREAEKPLRAPVVVVVSVVRAADPVVAAEDRDATAAAVQNLLLAAHALGYATIWRTGAMATAPAIAAHLGLPQSSEIVAFVYLGEAGMTPPPPERTTKGVVVRHD